MATSKAGGDPRRPGRPGHRIYWMAPVTMFASLACAILLALGHHSFYAHLAGSPTPIAARHIAGKSLSQQQLNISIGTLFAALVKTALVLAG